MFAKLNSKGSKMMREIAKEVYGVDVLEEVANALGDLVNTACANAGHPEVEGIQLFEEIQEYMEAAGLMLEIVDEGKPGCFGVVVADIENDEYVAVSRLLTVFHEDSIEIEGMSLNEKGLAGINKEYRDYRNSVEGGVVH